MSTKPFPLSRLSAVERLRAASDETPAPYFEVVSSMNPNAIADKAARYN